MIPPTIGDAALTALILLVRGWPYWLLGQAGLVGLRLYFGTPSWWVVLTPAIGFALLFVLMALILAFNLPGGLS